MKKIIFMFCIISMIFVCAPAFADDGAELLYFYDFENYFAESLGNEGPDSVWEPKLSKRIKAYDTKDTEHNKVMEISGEGSTGRAVMYFPGQIKQGQLHISFDTKFKTGNGRMLLLHYDRHYKDLDAIINDKQNEYAKTIYIGLDGKLKWYEDTPGMKNGNNLYLWTAQTYEKDVDFTEWHHYDIYFTEMSDTSNFTVDIYLDGERVNEAPVTGGNSTEFWTFEMRLNDDVAYIDNLYFHRYTGQEELSVNMIGASCVAQNNGEMNLFLNDYVDESLVFKENISIINKSTGEEVDNFDVQVFSEREFKIVFDGSIDYGDYELKLAPEVAGRLFGGTSITPFEFRTEYKPFLWETTYLDENFDGYVEEAGILPDGFVNVHSQEVTFAKSIKGSSGEDGDNALGFVNMERNRQAIAYIRKLEQAVNTGDEFDVEFDIYANNTQWYMYTTFDDECTELQKLLHCSNSGEAGYFTNNSETSATAFTSSVELEPGKWHNVRMYFEPDKTTGKTKVSVTIDSGTEDEREYIFNTNVDFTGNATTGIGFGYLSSSSADKCLGIDNFKVHSLINTPYPDVMSIKLYDGEDNEVNLLGKVRPDVYKAVILFNTKISENQGEFITFTEDGNSIPFEYETLVNDDGKSEIIMYFENLLEPLCSYNITVNEGVASAYSDDAKLFLKKMIKFNTNKASDYRVMGIEADGTVGSQLKFIKSSDAEGEYIYAVAVYYDKVIDNNIIIPTLMDFKYKYIKHNAEDEGVFISSIDMERDLHDGEYLKYYCIQYPSLNKLIPQADGTIN